MNVTEITADLIVLPDRVLAGGRLLVQDGRIAAIDSAAPSPAARVLRGTLLPGFVDLQVNGAGGRSIDEATPDALATVARSVFHGGATAFLPTLITAPWSLLLHQVRTVAQWLAAWDGTFAQPLGLHVEGPFLTNPGVHDARCFLDPTPTRLDELLHAAQGRLRLLTLASDRPGAAAAVARLVAAKVTVSIGHVATPQGLTACVDAGARMTTHLFNAMGPLHHREPGVAGTTLDERRLSCGIIMDGVHVHPAMLRLAFAALGPDRTVLVSDASAPAGMPDGEYTLAGTPVHLQDGVVRSGSGNLAGTALTMAQAAERFLRFVPSAGPWTLAQVAATNPARLIGAEHAGRIACGQPARFTHLGVDGRVQAMQV